MLDNQPWVCYDQDRRNAYRAIVRTTGHKVTAFTDAYLIHRTTMLKSRNEETFEGNR